MFKKIIKDCKDNFNIENNLQKLSDNMELIVERCKELVTENAYLREELEKEKKLNEYLKARFIECSTCTDEKKDECLMFSEGLCEGERCTEYVDLEGLLDKAATKGKVV